MPDKTAKTPGHLQPATAKWFEHVLGDFMLEAHHKRLLLLAAESWDRGVEARKAIEVNGLTFMDRFGQPHARPEVAIERDCRTAFARLLRELALDVYEPGDDLRPPVITGNANKRRA